MGKQLNEVKAALAALQDELNEAKEERKTAKSQLEKATAEQDIQKFKTLYEGAVANLTRLGQEKAELLKRETLLTRSPSISDEETQEISPVSDSSPKRQKIDRTIERTKPYLFRTESWGCVTIISKRTATAFAHHEHHTLVVGNTIQIYSLEHNSPYNVKVRKVNMESDWVLMEADVDLCAEEPIKGATADGRRYIQLGLSAPHQRDSPLAISTGVISSSRLNNFGHLLGSAGANPGDSGAPCFDVSTGELIGMNVGCDHVPISLEDTGTQIFDKISSRYAARAHIIPVSSLMFV